MGKAGPFLFARSALRLLVVVVVIVGVVLVWSARRRTHEDTWLQHRWLRLRGATYGLQNYPGSLPASAVKDQTGKTLYSWRFAIVSCLDEHLPKGDWTKPWRDAVNREAVECGNGFFCFSCYYASSAAGGWHSNMVVVTGQGTPFDTDQAHRYDAIPGQTILVLEVADSGAHWADPGDLAIDNLPRSMAEGLKRDGFLVAFADHQVWLLQRDTPLDVLRPFLTIEGAKKVKREESLRRYGREVRR